MKIKALGLMGIGDDGMLYTPKGKELIRLPFWMGCWVQKIQHKVAVLTWKLERK